MLATPDSYLPPGMGAILPTTTPVVSWPGIRGNSAMNSPSWICRSVPQTPQDYIQIPLCYYIIGLQATNSLWGELALTLIRTSPGLRVGRGTSTMPQTSGFSYLYVHNVVSKSSLTRLRGHTGKLFRNLVATTPRWAEVGENSGRSYLRAFMDLGRFST